MNLAHRNPAQGRPKVKCLLVDDLAENLHALAALLADDDVELLQRLIARVKAILRRSQASPDPQAVVNTWISANKTIDRCMGPLLVDDGT